MFKFGYKNIIEALPMLLIFIFSIILFNNNQKSFVNKTGINIWTETFGSKKDPAILLIAGAGGTALSWSDCFCKKLARAGFFVIRYDNRDTGKSTSINFVTNPYSLDDLALDAISVLDFYGIKKANIVGTSMGGFIAQILASKYKEYVSKLVLIASTLDNDSIIKAFKGIDISENKLPAPSKELIQKYKDLSSKKIKSFKDAFDSWAGKIKLYAGLYGYDESELKAMFFRLYRHVDNWKSTSNHIKLIFDSTSRELLAKEISVPTLIIHGSMDTLIPIEHAFYMYDLIPESKLFVIMSMSHFLSSRYDDILATAIINFL